MGASRGFYGVTRRQNPNIEGDRALGLRFAGKYDRSADCGAHAWLRLILAHRFRKEYGALARSSMTATGAWLIPFRLEGEIHWPETANAGTSDREE